MNICFYFYILSFHKIKSQIPKNHEEVIFGNKRAGVLLNRLNITDQMLRCGIILPKNQRENRGSDNATAPSSTIVSGIEQPFNTLLHSSQQNNEVAVCEFIEMKRIQTIPFIYYIRLG